MKFLIKSIIIKILTLEARLALRKFRPYVVAVTGNVGKTSAKDAIYAVLKTSFNVRKSEKSFNSDIGVPLTILGLSNGWNNPVVWLKNLLKGFILCLPKVLSSGSVRYPEWLILEIGADRPGDIARITSWLAPNVVVVTRIGEVPVHIEYFASVKEVIHEKSELVRALATGGHLVLNADDGEVLAMKDLREGKVTSYGLSSSAFARGSGYKVIYEGRAIKRKPCGISFNVEWDSGTIPITRKNSLGEGHMYPVLVAFAVGLEKGISFEVLKDSLNSYEAAPGRMKILEGIKGTTLVDDTYNASPAATSNALKTFASLKTRGKKHVVFGDMLELGKYSTEEHRKVGMEVAKFSLDTLITVGVRAREIAEGALDGGMSELNIFQYDEPARAGEHLQSLLNEGDIALVKGSQGMRMEKVVEEVMAHPEKAAELLVRQEKEWASR
ncbi:MAG: UDP-N-acetylmuramoyl-tripeptide--D-alanyl-D-alanine ligase [bacterium]|nr:UDP-N-acetylmuramoyl-tripeptide--D-alanyl-D-alanine ligase [bacterium]